MLGHLILSEVTVIIRILETESKLTVPENRRQV